MLWQMWRAAGGCSEAIYRFGVHVLTSHICQRPWSQSVLCCHLLFHMFLWLYVVFCILRDLGEEPCGDFKTKLTLGLNTHVHLQEFVVPDGCDRKFFTFGSSLDLNNCKMRLLLHLTCFFRWLHFPPQ